jgi:hypothetical protein
MNSIRILAAIVFISSIFVGCAPQVAPDLPTFSRSNKVDFKQVEPIINSRCIACHSCLESPCQLNMQTWAGLQRGAFHENAYDGLRMSAVPPTRMFEDASSTYAWRQKGFVDVLNGGDDSIFTTVLRFSNAHLDAPKRQVVDSQYCPQNKSDLKVRGEAASEIAMPYGLPPLPLVQQELLADWVAGGARGSQQLEPLPSKVQKQVKEWESFFNASDSKSKLVARYLYEHLFLAHLYFNEAPRTFFRLVRSSTSCEQGIVPIATRRPNDTPGIDAWFYCLSQDPATVVYKNHIPYLMGNEKLAWLKKNFFERPWTATAFPSFEPSFAGNPLKVYADIPVLARYQFLLENAQYELMTFIKGPVCNGSFAVNSIQEQFYVFFIDPFSDLMVKNPQYARNVADQLILPGNLGSNPDLKTIATGYKSILDHRAISRQVQAQELRSAFPNGFSLSDIWDGEGKNNNAVLTVFRHDDNAKVVKGARGDLAKTAWILDYSTMERLAYNLVVNFDTFDNVAHQTLTRLYMDVLRMDAEDNFLYFLPPKDRLRVKEQWYQGLATGLKLKLLGENKFADIPNAIPFQEGANPKRELVQKILFRRLNEQVRGPEDTLNWKALRQTANSDVIEKQLRRITSIPVIENAFPKLFPELSFLIIEKEGRIERTYSILHHREHENLSWIMSENSRLSPEQDSLTILPGIMGAYPNQFLVVEEAVLPQMIDQILSIKGKKEYRQLAKDFFVDRYSPKIWDIYDTLNAQLLAEEPVEAGILDLSRYSIESP